MPVFTMPVRERSSRPRDGRDGRGGRDDRFGRDRYNRTDRFERPNRGFDRPDRDARGGERDRGSFGRDRFERGERTERADSRGSAPFRRDNDRGGFHGRDGERGGFERRDFRRDGDNSRSDAGGFQGRYSHPAKENQQGFDGEVELGKGKGINLSIKNYSISLHHKDFMGHATGVEKLVNTHLNVYKCPSLKVIIHKKTGYPSAADWKELSDNIHGCFITYNNLGKKFLRAEIADWSVILQELIPQDGTFANLPKSYTFIISAQFHKNEEKNLFDKLDEAVANIVKHQPVETTDKKNCVIIHLPMIVSRKNCRQWAIDYFKNFPDKPISAIILVQPLVVKDQSDKEFISIGTSIIGRIGYANDLGSVLPLQFKMPVGERDNLFYKPVIFIRENGKSALKIEMENVYVYQQGHHYYEAKIDADGAIVVPIVKIASGIIRHTVFLGIEVVGRFEAIDKLEIL